MQNYSNVRILIVDDTESMRKTIKMFLEEMEFTDISEARDGLLALSELKRKKYDLLISDWNMPHMDGISLVRMIRSDDALKDMKVLMVTAEAHQAHVLEAIKIGITDYIVKPFTGDVLQRKVAAMLAVRPPNA